MYEVLSECITKVKEATFVDYTRIDLKEFSSFSATGEDSIETGDKRTLLSKAQPLILENIAKNLDKTVLKLKEKAESQGAELQISYQEQLKYQQEKDQFEQGIENLKQEIEKLTQERNDTKIEMELL